MRMRVNKYLAGMGVAARRKVDELIKAGKVKVNGVTAQVGMGVDPDKDRVEVEGRIMGSRPTHTYILVNKPVGVVTAVTDKTRRTVVDLVGIPERIFPVGRLDVDSEGLVLLTNDGELAQRLTHPKFGIEKEYEVEVKGKITAKGLGQLRRGVRVGGELTLPAIVERMGENRLRMVIREGKNRQVRRMCKAVNLEVVGLKRVRLGEWKLSGLKRGEWQRIAI